VKPAPFAYRRPETLEEAVRLLAELMPQDGRVLAGGRSLVPIMNFRLARPAYLIDIYAAAGLDRLAAEDGVRHQLVSLHRNQLSSILGQIGG
jgi:carbon-monoxide dehydrogenase medium subunit